MSLSKTLLAAVVALSLAGCASIDPGGSPPDPVRQALALAGLPESALGVAAFPLDAPQAPGLRLQAERSMAPGSAMKLVTAVVALDKLGPTSRGRTELLAEAAPVDGVLAGPLYLRGGADDGLDWGALWTLLRSLREQQGLREIRGGLVVDRSLFQPARLDIGVPPFDEAPEFPYNVIPDALNLNGQLLGLVLQSDAEQLRGRLFPAWPGMRVDASAVTLADHACKDWEQHWQVPRLARDADGAAVVQLGGRFPRHCKVEPQLNVMDRQLLAAQAVRQIWRELGGTLEGPDREGTTPPGAQRLAQHLGRPLGEALRGMMKSSDNPLTRLVYLRLGAAGAAPGEDTRAAAERAVRAWFAEQGIPDAGLVMDNGSGLSRSERASPAQLAALLVAAQRGRHGPELLASLPLAGVDGTLSRRFKGSPAEGRARLKTGTLRDAVALAGYVPDRQGRLWVVAAIVNDAQAMSKGRPVLDAVVDWLAGR